MPFVTKKECAFEVILKWRYDDVRFLIQINKIIYRLSKSIRRSPEEYIK